METWRYGKPLKVHFNEPKGTFKDFEREVFELRDALAEELDLSEKFKAEFERHYRVIDKNLELREKLIGPYTNPEGFVGGLAYKICKEIVEIRSQRQIADALDINPYTVSYYNKKIRTLDQ